TLSATFTDAGASSSHTVDVNWGDGSAHTVLNLPINVLTLTANHQYVTNLPGSVPYTVLTTVTSDATSASTSAATSVTVQNVAPSITNFSPDTGVVGDHITSATNLTLTGTAAAGSTVKLYAASKYTPPLGTGTADSTGKWSIDYTAAFNSVTSFTVTSTDPGGNTTAPSTPFDITVTTDVFSPSGQISTDLPTFSWP